MNRMLVQLGKTDLLVSRICFGSWQLSPKFWGEIDLEPWREAIKKALDVGVNFIDTADAYGDGHSERELGKFLRRENLRDEFVLATKFYWNFEKDQRHPDTSYDYILRECEASLKRLQTDHIDLYQIHSWDPLTRPDEVALALNKLRRQGKVRWFGVSNLNPEQMRLYMQHMDVECLQPPYSLLDRRMEDAELPFCLSQRMGVITYSPLFRGILSGKYAKDHTFQDPRSNNPYFTGEPLKRLLEGVDEIRPLAEKHHLTPAQFAVRWILTHPAVTSAIVGIKNAEQIETIAPAAEKTLPTEDWHKAAKIMSRAKKEADKML